MTSRFTAALLAAALSSAAFAQTRPASAPATAPAPHSDAQLAHDLFRLKQIDPLKAQLEAAKNSPTAPIWKAELLLAQWDDQAKNRTELAREYLDLLAQCLALPPAQIDGNWALDHARFILVRLSQPIINRMELWANGEKDRAALKPCADICTQLLQRAAANLDTVMKAAESAKPFDEKSYTRAYSGVAEVKYYAGLAQYFKAMCMSPSDPARKPVLEEAAAALNDWAVDDTDNGVNFEAYLARGKVFSEAGNYDSARKDFEKAQNEKAPAWLQYQGRYQTVVAYVRAKDFKAAAAALDTLKRSVPKDNTEAHLSIDMLAYRVAWAKADTAADDVDRKTARLDALSILDGIIEKDPRFRDLVYQQLAAQIPDKAELSTLLPMQLVALAYFNSQGQKGDTPESRSQLQTAVAAARAALANPLATRTEKSEATYLAGACNAVLGNLPDAARYEVEFAEANPKDPRAKPLTGLALEQIGELRKLTPATGPSANTLSPELRAIAVRALKLATESFGENQWRYAQALMLEDDGKADDAAAVYEKIPPDDKNYLDARYHLVTLATTRFSALGKAPDDQMKAAAQRVFAACSSFIALLDNPPASFPKDVLERIQSHRYDVWIMESATALNPAVRDSATAIDRLNKLDQAKASLTDPQRAAVLKFRIEAYEMAGQSEKAFEAVQQYAKEKGQDAMGVIQNMALTTMDQIDALEPTDPARAKELATYLVRLLDPIIKQTAGEGKTDAAFAYRVIQADMMVRGGQYADAQKLAVQLQTEKPAELHSYFTEARAMFAEAQATGNKDEFARAQDYYGRILQKLAPGSESFWEAWLRMIQSMEGRAAPSAFAEIKTKLGDLHAIYGSKFGGETYKSDFQKLWSRYGI